MTSPRDGHSNRPLSSSSDSVGENDEVIPSTCCPWRMPRARIPAALRTFQLKLRGCGSVTSQRLRQTFSSGRGLRSSIRVLFGKLRSNRVQPFNGAPDVSAACPLEESRSVGAVTDHFARLALMDSRYQSKSGPELLSWSLPGAVNEDITACEPSTSGSKLSENLDNESDNNIPAPLISDGPVSSDADDSTKKDGGVGEEGVKMECRNEDDPDILFLHQDNDDIDLRTDISQDPKSPRLSPRGNHEDTSAAQEGCLVDASSDDDKAGNEEETILSMPADSEALSPDCHDDDENGRRTVPYEDEDNVHEEVEFFDATSEESDDYLDIDVLLDQCPQTDIIRNLQSAVQLSRCATRQLERSLKKWSRISRGPFPRQPGRDKTKAAIIDERSAGLRRESARYLDEMNRLYFNFYCVTEELDEVEMRQARLVESIKEEMEVSQVEDDFELPRRKQDWADMCLGDRKSGRLDQHKFKALLGKRIPATISEEDEEE